MLYEDSNRKLWEYVCHVPDPGAPGARAVLRGTDGKTIEVAGEDLGDSSKPYRLFAQGKQSAGVDEAIKETLNLCRQISGLRFFALPLFLTATAALAKEYLTNVTLMDEPSRQMAEWTSIPAAGLILSLILLVFETVLSFNLISWWRAIEIKASSSPWTMTTAHRNTALLWLARIALFLPYPIAAAYWSSKIPGFFSMDLWLGALLLGVPSVLVWLWAELRRIE